ncbi:MAG: MBL fold metallo-hydrolase [Bacteroidales bacterium]
MKSYLIKSLLIFTALFLSLTQEVCMAQTVTVPVTIDHNRMLVDAQMQRKDGTWRKVRLWVDSGNPTLSLSEELAKDLGIDMSAATAPDFKASRIGVENAPLLKFGEFQINTNEVNTIVMFQPFWLFTTMHADANLPSSILKRYNVVFDYPNRELSLSLPGSTKPVGVKSNASIHPLTGIAAIDAVAFGDSLRFALDMGASYSFVSEDILLNYSGKNPDLPIVTGAFGCANMWGWWPANEQNFPVVKLPVVKWGSETFTSIGFVGVPKFSPAGPTLGEWYSGKTAKPVDGFIGTNALMDYRVEIDYAGGAVYFQKGEQKLENDSDIVGIAVRQLADGSYQVVGIVHINGRPVIEGVEPGDILISVDGFAVAGKTMGSVVDKLRGRVGDTRKLLLNRGGKEIVAEVKINSLLASAATARQAYTLDQLDQFTKVDRLSERVLVVSNGISDMDRVTAIATKKGIVVIDAGTNGPRTARYRAIVEREFKRNDFVYLINTHSHQDHTFGNRAFGEATVIGHEMIKVELAENFKNDYYTKIFTEALKNWETRVNEAEKDSGRWKQLRIYLYEGEEILSTISGNFKIPYPDISFKDTMDLDMGDLTIKMKYFGPAHTNSDILIYIPEERILFVGDLFSNPVKVSFKPSGKENAIQWINALDYILKPENQIEFVVNGHTSNIMDKNSLLEFYSKLKEIVNQL